MVRKEDGQVLIMVSIMVMVLLMFVALAIDVGSFYATRRQAQNAADAGALAGARALCLGQDWQAAANKYVGQNNAVANPAPQLNGNVVEVVANIPATTFLAGALGLTTPGTISAEAKAACGISNSSCGVIPISFKMERWNELACGEQFFVWDGGPPGQDPISIEAIIDTYIDTSGNTDFCDVYNCTANIGSGTLLGTDDRGWLTFPSPAAPVEDWTQWSTQPGCNSRTCGGNTTTCDFIHSYPGEIYVGQCLAAQPGVTDTTRENGAAPWVAMANEELRMVLYEEANCTGATCPSGNKTVTVADFGCVSIEETRRNYDFLINPAYEQYTRNPTNYLPNRIQNVKGIKATKKCDCAEVDCGSTDGATPGDVNSVNLLP